MRANPAVDPVPFGHWTKSSQKRDIKRAIEMARALDKE
jgi:hypothetical protein